jgi:hypothetical protein
MSWGFEEGRVYNRRADIHAKFGGQQQGGIITHAQHPLVIIITGEAWLMAMPIGHGVWRIRIFRGRPGWRFGSTAW